MLKRLRKIRADLGTGRQKMGGPVYECFLGYEGCGWSFAPDGKHSSWCRIGRALIALDQLILELEEQADG